MELVEEVAGVVGHDRAGWSGPALSAELVELLAARDRLDAEILRCVGEWDGAGAWAEDGAATPASWLAHRAPLTRAEAQRMVRTARLARDHERTGKALAAGDVSRAHVEVLAAAVREREDVFASGDHEDVLVDAAQTLRPDELRTAARRWRCLADDDVAGADAYRDYQRRHVHASATFGGRVVGELDLDADGGTVFCAALEARDRPDPKDHPGGPRTRSQRWADILVEIMSESLAATNAPRTRAGRAPVGVDVVLDVDTLAGRAPTDLTTARCDVAGVGPVARETALRLACDAAIGRVVMRGRSEILDLGRRTREPSPAQRRALAIRDGGCAFPGCDRPPWWCDAHHLDHWIHGGNTDLDDLALLCRHHHVLCHEGGWTLVRRPDGTIEAVPP